ncbi:MAG: hypothetical protein R3E89_20035 [Thiolinea sp.]
MIDVDGRRLEQGFILGPEQLVDTSGRRNSVTCALNIWNRSLHWMPILS